MRKNKKEYIYSAKYHDWRRDRLSGKAPAAIKDKKYSYQEAAE
jgi:hypothetical protein